MFVTLGYIVSELCKWYSAYVSEMRYLRLVQRHIANGTLRIRNVQNFKATSAVSSDGSKKSVNCTDLLRIGDKHVQLVTPKVHLDLKDWTAYLDKQDYLFDQHKPDELCYVHFETIQAQDQEDFFQKSLSIPKNKQVKVIECTSPIAWRAGSPFGIVAECTTQNVARLIAAFMDGCLILDDMLELSQMQTVLLEGHAANLLRINSSPDATTPTEVGDQSSIESPSKSDRPPSVNKSDPRGSSNKVAGSQPNTDTSTYAAHSFASDRYVSDLISAEANPCTASNESLADLDSSVGGRDQYAAMSDLMSHEMLEAIQTCEDAGEALSDSIAELAPETLTPVRRFNTTQGKPPNVLIYCGKKDAVRRFESVKSTVMQCINSDRYTVYHLKHEHVLSTPWAQNAALLIVSSEKAYDGCDQAFLNFFQNGGSLVSFGCALDTLFVKKKQRSTSLGMLSLNYKLHRGVSVICARHEYADCESLLAGVHVQCLGTSVDTGQAVMLEVVNDLTGGVAVLSQVNLDLDASEMAISPEIFARLKQANVARFAILKDVLVSLGMDCSASKSPDPTPAFLLSVSKKKKDAFLNCVQNRLNNEGQLKSRNMSLMFTSDLQSASKAASLDNVPVLINADASAQHFNFNWSHYQANLKTKVLGQTVIYSDVMTSTMNIFDGLMLCLPKDVGVAAIAGRQISGKGRGGNTWLSPEGCALFSLHVQFSTMTPLGERPAFVQHIAATAIILAIKSFKGCQNLNVKIKWPNDIWYGKMMKLGGVIVQSTILQQTFHANIGIGVNVNNKNPTLCVNDLIDQQLKKCKDNSKPILTEELIARVINNIESLIDQFQSHGPKPFLNLYQNNWLHSNAIVQIEREENATVRLVGLDKHGYLKAERKDGSCMSLQDDGNSFDMMANLIRLK